MEILPDEASKSAAVKLAAPLVEPLATASAMVSAPTAERLSGVEAETATVPLASGRAMACVPVGAVLPIRLMEFRAPSMRGERLQG